MPISDVSTTWITAVIESSKDYLTYIDKNTVNSQWLSEDAVTFYRYFYAAKPAIRIGKETNAVNIPGIKSWPELRSELGTLDWQDDLYTEMIRRFLHYGISSVIIYDLKREWDKARNEAEFRQYINLNYTPAEQQLILKALVQVKALQGGKQLSGKPEVEYYNHPVQVAGYVALAGLPAGAVTAALLHDLIEDTPVTALELVNQYPKEVVEMVIRLSRDPAQSRQEYLLNITSQSGDIKLIKCFDRFHNLLRAFTFNKKSYHRRYLDEFNRFYLTEFQTNGKLQPYLSKSELYITELKRLFTIEDG